MMLIIVNEIDGFIVDNEGQKMVKREHVGEAIEWFEDRNLPIYYIEGEEIENTKRINKRK